MTKNVFFVSDTHFGHVGCTKFMRADGVTKLRPWDNVIEMDEHMVERWNAIVRPHDKVYHVGDVVINRKALPIMERLNGDKVLIKGNHDIFRLEDYSKYFRDIRAYMVFDRIIVSHIPIHHDSRGRFRFQIHGHTHDRVIMTPTGEVDPWYFNACVEHTNWGPIAREEILSIQKTRLSVE